MISEWNSWEGLAIGAALTWGAGASVVVAVCDLRWRRIPDRIVLPALVGVPGLLSLPVLMHTLIPWQWPPTNEDLGGAPALGTGVLVGTTFALVHLALALAGGLGGGDVKFALLLGILLGAAGGWEAAWWGGVLSWASAGISALILPGRACRPDGIPFAPFLVLGCWPVIAGAPWVVHT